jgi:hypothetical protein
MLDEEWNGFKHEACRDVRLRCQIINADSSLGEYECLAQSCCVAIP